MTRGSRKESNTRVETAAERACSNISLSLGDPRWQYDGACVFAWVNIAVYSRLLPKPCPFANQLLVTVGICSSCQLVVGPTHISWLGSIIAGCWGRREVFSACVSWPARKVVDGWRSHRKPWLFAWSLFQGYSYIYSLHEYIYIYIILLTSCCLLMVGLVPFFLVLVRAPPQTFGHLWTCLACEHVMS